LVGPVVRSAGGQASLRGCGREVPLGGVDRAILSPQLLRVTLRKPPSAPPGMVATEFVIPWRVFRRPGPIAHRRQFTPAKKRYLPHHPPIVPETHPENSPATHIICAPAECGEHPDGAFTDAVTRQ
jgi:hypothetical protein